MKQKEEQMDSDPQVKTKLGDMFNGMPTIKEEGIPLRMLTYGTVYKRYKLDMWTTQDGRTIYLKDMTTTHIFNLLRMRIKRHKNTLLKSKEFDWDTKLIKELENRNTPQSKEALLKLLLLK